MLGATLCYCTRAFLFQHNARLNVIGAIDFDVLLLLASIMVIGFY